MSTSQNKFFAWQETRFGLVVIFLFDLLIAYIFASFAIGSGSLIDYAIAIIFLVLALTAIVKFIGKLLRHA